MAKSVHSAKDLLPWGAPPLDDDHEAVLAALERSAPIRLIATFDGLVVAHADEVASDALARANDGRFDFLPVRSRRDGPIIGLFRRKAFGDGGIGLVRDVMQPLSGDILIGADAPLLDFIYAADTHPCRLVLDRATIRGIVTLSDIQRLPVRTVLFGLFIHLELLLTRALRHTIGDDRMPFDLLSDERARAARKQWKRSVDAQMDRDPFNALNLADKKIVAMKVGLLGRPAEDIDEELGRIARDLRNPIAHGKDIALTEAAAHRMVAAARLVQDWIRMLRTEMPIVEDAAGATGPR